jgi:hypothetical protein
MDRDAPGRIGGDCGCDVFVAGDDLWSRGAGIDAVCAIALAAGYNQGMEPNPYEAPKEVACEQAEPPTEDTTVRRMFAAGLVIFVVSGFVWLLGSLLYPMG